MISEQHPFGRYHGDFTQQLKAALSDFVTLSLLGFKSYLDMLAEREAEARRHHSDDAAVAAGLLLEVNLDASADEVRRALRRKLSTARMHPDHGGNGARAAQLIAAKNLLIERLKEEG